MNRKRALLYAALVLAVPLPALALERGQSAASLDVQASLGGCGVAETAISCRIDIAFSHIPDVEYYTASVTAPDGSVVELGTIASGGGGASTSASVPFSGNGDYTVTVSAWGYDERGRPDVVESERAGAGRGAEVGRSGEVEAPEPVDEPAPPVADPPAPGEPPTPPGIEQPECPEATEEAESDETGSEPDAEPEPDPAAQSPQATDPGCVSPPQEPVPPPVP
jgi:hypothetical protein